MRTFLISTAIGLLVNVSIVSATAQRGDILRLNGEEYAIQTNPLEPHLDKYPEKRPPADIVSTSLWRRYVATWEVRDEQLFLVDVEILREKSGAEHFEAELYSSMDTFFPGVSRVLASWFTGNIIIPRGELLEYVHLDYASTYEEYIVLAIREGRVLSERVMSSPEFLAFREAQFRAYQRTDEYKARAEKLKDPGETDEEIEEFLFSAAASRYLSLLQDSESEETLPAKEVLSE